MCVCVCACAQCQCQPRAGAGGGGLSHPRPRGSRCGPRPGAAALAGPGGSPRSRAGKRVPQGRGSRADEGGRAPSRPATACPVPSVASLEPGPGAQGGSSSRAPPPVRGSELRGLAACCSRGPSRGAWEPQTRKQARPTRGWSGAATGRATPDPAGQRRGHPGSAPRGQAGGPLGSPLPRARPFSAARRGTSDGSFAPGALDNLSSFHTSPRHEAGVGSGCSLVPSQDPRLELGTAPRAPPGLTSGGRFWTCVFSAPRGEGPVLSLLDPFRAAAAFSGGAWLRVRGFLAPSEEAAVIPSRPGLLPPAPAPAAAVGAGPRRELPPWPGCRRGRTRACWGGRSPEPLSCLPARPRTSAVS